MAQILVVWGRVVDLRQTLKLEEHKMSPFFHSTALQVV
jgi:hypothetical protein